MVLQDHTFLLDIVVLCHTDAAGLRQDFVVFRVWDKSTLPLLKAADQAPCLPMFVSATLHLIHTMCDQIVTPHKSMLHVVTWHDEGLCQPVDLPATLHLL